MKQHITIEQLNELSEEGKEKLLQYMEDKDYLPHGTQMMLHNEGYYLSQFLSIGKMIEFLDEHTNELGMQFNDSSTYWSIWYGGEQRIEYNNLLQYELCDALWEACQEVLEQ